LKPQVNALAIDPATDFDLDLDEFKDEMTELELQAQLDQLDEEGNLQNKNKKIHCHNMTTNASLNKKYVFPLLLQNKQAFALCDSGANTSVIDIEFINKNKINIDSSYSTTIQWLPQVSTC
jgi:hypothetical protein